ncbi:MAG: preprotein translocase subunit SecE [Planctomycetaceae bacterium]
MAKKNDDTGYLASLAETGLYKRNQGRLTRQLTAVSFALIVILGCWTLSRGPLGDYDKQAWIQVGIPVVIALFAGWIIYRSVNYPKFADFLISVEAEMDKVTWATKQDLYRSAAVVIGAMFFLGFVLFLYDLFWQWFFQLIGFLQLGPG